MKLYMHPISGCSRRVLSFVALHQLELELELVDLERGAHKHPAYLKLNPTGRVPTLDDGELVLWESGAILRHLAATYHPQSLGKDDTQRARVDQWMLWALIHLGSALATLNAETGLKRLHGLDVEPHQVERALSQAHDELNILGEALDGQLYLCGDEVTLADHCACGSIEASLILARLEIKDPRVKAWLDRIHTLPNWPQLTDIQTNLT